jgi:D-xylose 1-dehydrogenase (NADP+, D-xylono-1,5-lactone-forming)
MIRLGILSTATIAVQSLRAAAATPAVEFVAVASRESLRAQAYALEHAIPRPYGSYEELLDDPDVDAVYNPLPNSLHHEWTMRALAAGKHVLCEKPYSRHPAEVDEAFDRADGAGLVLMEAFMYRHHPQTHRVAELVADGALGRVRLIRASFSFVLQDATNIRALPELDGGALMDIGCYCVSGPRLLAGEPERVSAEQVTGPTGVDLAFHGTMRFANDVVAQFDSSFALPRSQRLEVEGEDASLLVESPWRTDWPGAVVLRRGDEVEHVEVGRADSYELQLENFAAAIEGLAAPLLGREDALGQARAIEALYRSATEGRALEL